MLKHILKVIALTLCTNILIANAVTTYDVGLETKEKPALVSESEAEIKQILFNTTAKYGISDQNELLVAVIRCESHFNTKAVNDSPIEFSVGLVQINLRAHTNVTYSQAIDPVFAIDFLVKNVAEGRGSMWTCWQKLSK